MKSSTQICLVCEMKKYPIEKIIDENFFMERKNEFYPEEEFGDSAFVCPKCHEELLEYFLNK